MIVAAQTQAISATKLVINVKTARALGLKIPQGMLARADQINEGRQMGSPPD